MHTPSDKIIAFLTQSFSQEALSDQRDINVQRVTNYLPDKHPISSETYVSNLVTHEIDHASHYYPQYRVELLSSLSYSFGVIVKYQEGGYDFNCHSTLIGTQFDIDRLLTLFNLTLEALNQKSKIFGGMLTPVGKHGLRVQWGTNLAIKVSSCNVYSESLILFADEPLSPISARLSNANKFLRQCNIYIGIA